MRCNNRTTSHTQGLSLVEVIFVASIVTVFFVGLFGSFRYTLELVSLSRSQQTARSVAVNALEYIHSLSYDAVGTVSGIPSGAIPQTATTSLNNIDFTIDTLIEYVDSAADGEAGADENAITTDYKQAKVTVSWQVRGVTHTLSLQSLIIPRSIETDEGGGTLRVNVFDADVAPLSGASVRVVNTLVSPAIDVTRTTNDSGVALFSGAPASAGYEITVTKSGYSTDGTNNATTELVNPSTRPATVAEADVTTLNFFIDALSDVTIRTIAGNTVATWSDDYATTTSLATSSDVAVSGGVMVLYDDGGGYVSEGTARSVAVTPPSIVSWGTLTIAETVTSQTARLVQVYDAGSATATLVSDADLPGNSTGFTASALDLSGLDPITYPSLSIGLVLQSATSTETPELDEVSITYISSETPIASVPLAVTGSKILGTNASSAPVYKYDISTTTDGSGERDLTDIEWDTYDVVPAGYTVSEACPMLPLSVAPGDSTSLTLTLTSYLAHSLRVHVVDADGISVPAADVTLSRAGYSSLETTGTCGQVLFTAPGNFDDYTIDVEYGGSIVWSQSSISVSGATTLVIELP